MVAPGRPPPPPATPRQPPPNPSQAVARRWPAPRFAASSSARCLPAAYVRGGGALGGLSWVSLRPSLLHVLPARCACLGAWQRVPACAAGLAHPHGSLRRPLPCGRSWGPVSKAGSLSGCFGGTLPGHARAGNRPGVPRRFSPPTRPPHARRWRSIAGAPSLAWLRVRRLRQALPGAVWCTPPAVQRVPGVALCCPLSPQRSPRKVKARPAAPCAALSSGYVGRQEVFAVYVPNLCIMGTKVPVK